MDLLISNEAPAIADESRRIVGIVIGSFRFSRGDVNTQQVLLSYLANNVCDPFDVSSFEAAKEFVGEACNRIVGGRMHPQGDPALAESIGQTYVKYFMNSFAANPRLTTIGTVTAKLLRRDEYFSRSVLANPAPSETTYRSNIVHHTLLRKKTGVPEFDFIFARSRTALPYVIRPTSFKPTSDRLNPDILERVVKAHISANPTSANEVLEAYNPYHQAL